MQVVQPQQGLKTVIAQPDELARMDMSRPQPSSDPLLPTTRDSPTSTSRDQLVALTTVQGQYVQHLIDRELVQLIVPPNWLVRQLVSE